MSNDDIEDNRRTHEANSGSSSNSSSYHGSHSNRECRNAYAKKETDEDHGGYNYHHGHQRGYHLNSNDHQQTRGYSSIPKTNSTTIGGHKRHRGDNEYDDATDYYYHEAEEYKNWIQEPSDGWECLECTSWNYGIDVECTGCGVERVTSHKNAIDSAPGNKSFSQELDEFGRNTALRLGLTKKKKGKKKSPPVWPPSFDQNGSAFVFDTRSGMFYESETDFFYDPMSKLYYGNKQCIYYRYDDTTKRFVEVQAVAKGQSELAIDEVSPDWNTKESNTNSNKPSISIKLKTKSLPSAKKTNSGAKFNSVSAAPVAPRVTKKHAADINKWSDRQAEIRHDEQQSAIPMPESKPSIATTAKGEPICLLCRRKFPTLAKLEHHEKVSNLHKENLLKQEKTQQQQQQQVNESAQQAYLDRAHQRRIMYGSETLAPSTVVAVSSDIISLGSQSMATTVPSVPEDNLGVSNIGNQMLQKLGWKGGASLGHGKIQKEPTAMIKKDWEKIESLAANGGKGKASSGGIGTF